MAADATTASLTWHLGVSFVVEDDEALPLEVDGNDVELDTGQPVELLERHAPAALPTELADLALENLAQPVGKRVLIQVAGTVAHPK